MHTQLYYTVIYSELEDSSQKSKKKSTNPNALFLQKWVRGIWALCLGISYVETPRFFQDLTELPPIYDVGSNFSKHNQLLSPFFSQHTTLKWAVTLINIWISQKGTGTPRG